MRRVMLSIAMLMVVTGCASERYMSPEQDAEFKANCEPAGCVVVPIPLMRQLLDRLKGISI